MTECAKISSCTKSLQKLEYWPGMVVHACNPTTPEVEAGGFQVQGQPE
jgi:hypothetical protein